MIEANIKVNEQRKKIHPHKFTLWVAIGSIVMMFAGLTSAYVVKRNQANWVSFELPRLFWFSTLVIVISSLTMFMAMRAFKERAMMKYRSYIAATLFAGVLFIVLQVIGFAQLWSNGITLQASWNVLLRRGERFLSQTRERAALGGLGFVYRALANQER